MKPYDDDRYLEWHREFNVLVNEYLNTQGSTKHSLRDEFEVAIENAEMDA